MRLLRVGEQGPEIPALWTEDGRLWDCLNRDGKPGEYDLLQARRDSSTHGHSSGLPFDTPRNPSKNFRRSLGTSSTAPIPPRHCAQKP